MNNLVHSLLVECQKIIINYVVVKNKSSRMLKNLSI